tara:strand:+ start:995 stop:1816 length:822 start_codon:yes stop_codon:yes gene_type:complete
MQRSAEWFAERVRKITASNLGACLGLVSYTSRIEAYNRAMGASPISEINTPEKKNEACEYGIANEPHAIAEYERVTGNRVDEARFVPHPTIKWIGASPDGYVGDMGMLEVKCPWFYKIPHAKVPMHYYLQMNCQLECTGRKWCDFVSWTPQQGMNIYRVLPDPTLFNWLKTNYLDDMHKAMEDNVGNFPTFKSGTANVIKCRIKESMDTHIVGYQRTILSMWKVPPPEKDPFAELECESSNASYDYGTNEDGSVPTMGGAQTSPYKRQAIGLL